MRREHKPAHADICALGLRGFPGVMGGIETHCEQIYRRIVAASRLRIVVLGRSPYSRRRMRPAPHLEVRPIAALRQKHLEALPNALLATLHAWLRERPRVLHVHAIGPALVTPLAKVLGMRVVVTHHGRDYARAKWNWLGKLTLRAGEWAALTFADRVIAVSPSLRQALCEAYPRRCADIRYIPNGATAESVRADDSVFARLGVAKRGYVLAIGRLVPEKGLHDLIAAFRMGRSETKLVIAGAADHDDSYARALRASADERIVFAGAMNRAELAALYAGASLFVLPSTHEGLPISALEAVAAGAPVLLSDIEPNRDIGLPAHNYFPAANVAALTDCLSASHDTYRVDRTAVLARFDWDRAARETLALYRDLMGVPLSEAPPARVILARPR